MQIYRNKDRWHKRNNNNLVTTQASKQKTNKQTSKKTTKETLCKKQRCICVVLIQGNEFWWSLWLCLQKTVKYLPKILFTIDIMDLHSFSCFCIYVGWFENVRKIWRCFGKLWIFRADRGMIIIWWNLIFQIWHTNNRKRKCISFIIKLVLEFFIFNIIERSKNYASEVEIFSGLTCNSRNHFRNRQFLNVLDWIISRHRNYDWKYIECLSCL